MLPNLAGGYPQLTVAEFHGGLKFPYFSSIDTRFGQVAFNDQDLSET